LHSLNIKPVDYFAWDALQDDIQVGGESSSNKEGATCWNI